MALSNQINIDLELLTKDAYNAFKRAVNTRDRRYAVSALLLYSDDLKRLLLITTGYAPKYMLEYALGDVSSVILENSLSHKERYGEGILLFPTMLNENNLMSAINNREIPYARIQDMAIELAHAGKFEIIVNALDYVRNNYKKP